MQPVEIILGFVRRIVTDLVLVGVVAFVIAALILLFPEFLRWLVGLLLVVFAVWTFNLAYKISKFSKIKFDL